VATVTALEMACREDVRSADPEAWLAGAAVTRSNVADPVTSASFLSSSR
jgi:hypothetical protein